MYIINMPDASSVGYGVVISMPLIFAVILKNFHMYWADHKRKYEKALLFLNSNACLDSGMKAALAEFNLCDSAMRITDVPPTLAAWYDVLEDLHVCGHGRCMQLYSDLTTKLPLIFMVAILLAYFIYKCFNEHRYRAGVRHWQLPQNNALMNN